MDNNHKSGRFIFAAFFLIAIILIAMLCFPGGCSRETESVTLAAVPTELNALVYVAQEKGFFNDNGLQVILKDYDSGATATTGMLKGEAEVALAAEFPIVRHVYNKAGIVNFGTVAKYENTYIIWHADSGIQSIRDLVGKRIGVTFQTISEFYLGRTLTLNGVDMQHVTLVDVKAADSERALVNKEVDAVVTWEPWVEQINRLMGKAVITKAAQSSQYAYWNLVSTTGWTSSHADTMKRLIKSLALAENFIGGRQDEAKSIVSEWMDFDREYTDTIWPRYQFALSLDQSLIIAMEDEARWMMENNLTVEKSIPNFIDYIYEDTLKEVKPEAVNIIRKEK